MEKKSCRFSAETDIITISQPYPADQGVSGTLNPELSVRVEHRNGKSMDVIFKSDAGGVWREIKKFPDVHSGVFRARPRDMRRRGTTYNWQVVATDGKFSQSRTFSFNLSLFVGSKNEAITHSDCWKYGYIKHGWEKGRFFVTTQRGTWAGYDIDRGWYRTYQRLMQREKMTGNWMTLEDGGNLGHPFWGYWDGMYHAISVRITDGLGWEEASSRTFEDFGKLVYEKDMKDTGTRTNHINWHEGTTYTFNEDRAWIMAIDFDEESKTGRVKYWQWTKKGGWQEPVTVGSVSNHTGRVALVRHTRDIWYLFVTEGKVDGLDGQAMSFESTLKYFKSVDAGKTWSGLTCTGIPAHAIWSSVSFARYGDNYYVFLSEDKDSYIYFTRDLENWKIDHLHKTRVAKGMWCKPHGTLLHPSALILTVAANISYHDEQYGIIAVVPEMISHPGKPSDPSPRNNTELPSGTREIEISVKVHGPQTYDVAFYLADGTFIGEDKLLREGDTARMKMEKFEPGKTCSWYAVARGALLEYYGTEPDTTGDEEWSDIFSFKVSV